MDSGTYRKPIDKRVRRARRFLTLSVLAMTSLWAHAILVTSTPKPNSEIDGGHVTFSLTFNSRVDQGRSKLSVEGPDQTMTPVTIAKLDSEPAKLGGELTGLHSGSYKLHWQVLAVDGHITRGVIPFRVK